MLKKLDGCMNYGIDSITGKLHKMKYKNGKLIDLGEISDAELKKIYKEKGYE